ncbi:MAG TPA: triple tyrosine motif-containing protein [Bacteroidales bacterium]|nr:triple tyrosine motif-containing protein [Bacteroidales bacterium]
MIRLLITLFILIVYPKFVSGQVNKGGVPLIENISTLNTPGAEQNWCAVRDKRGIMYFGNQEGGVIEYDGHFWNLIPTPNGTRIYDMAVDEDGTVYVGSAYEFGYLAPGEMGSMAYVSLMPKIDSSYAEDMGEVWSVLVDSNHVYFSTLKRFFVYNINNQQVEIYDHSEYLRTVFHLEKIGDRIFASDNFQGLFELKTDSLVAAPGGDYFTGMPVMTMIPGKEDGEVIIGTYYSGITKLNYLTGEVDEDFIDSSVNEFLAVANVYNGFRLTDTTFIIGTVSGGGSFIFNLDGELLEQFSSENSELFDDSIMSMYFDFNEGYPVLWLTNYGYISKAYFGLPFKVVNMDLFSNSALNSLMVYKGDLYVSNDVGLMKNTVDQNGYMSFEMVEGIAAQTFPLLNFKFGSADLLLIGTISGLYSYDGTNTVKIDGDKNMYVRSLLQSREKPDLLFVGQERGSVDILKYNRGIWEIKGKIAFFGDTRISGNILSIAEDEEGVVWFATDAPSNLYRIKFNETDTLVQRLDQSNGITAKRISSLIKLEEDLLIGTDNGLMRYDRDNDMFVTEEKYLGTDLQTDLGFDNIYQDNDGDIWFGVNNPRNFIYYYPEDIGSQGIISRPFFMLPNTNTTDFTEFKGNIWIVKSKQLFVVNKNLLEQYQGTFKTLIRRVVINSDSVYFAGTFYTTNETGKRIPVAKQPVNMIPEFKYSDNDVSFFYSSPFYLEEDSIRYSYVLQGFDNEWSRWDNVNYRDYTNLPHGRYTFRVRSRNVLGSYGEEATYEFIIQRPLYLTLVAMFGYIVLAVLLIYIIIKVYTRRLINENIRLEGIVAERTAEVVRQKEELEASIHYASRIQRAILPSQKVLKEKVKDYFILFRPRDIVSGDFYWVTEKDNRVYICAADCTGHGVPGAFMSLLGISFLDEIVNKSGVMETNEVLNALRLHVTNSLKQMGENEEETKDGMDLGLLVVDFVDNMIEFSGAYNPCWTVRPMSVAEKRKYLNGEVEDERGSLSNGEYLLETIEADRMPIGISTRMNQPFGLYKQKVNRGVTYYLSSDGYSDQFGGKSGRKFLKKNLKKLMLDIQGVPLNQQKELLEGRLLDWMGENPQVDDILIIGLQII